jgi:hypothetical protein
VSGGREPGRRGTTLAPLGNTLLPAPGFHPRAKIATGRYLLFKRIASNFIENPFTTSSCTFTVFQRKGFELVH